MRPTKSATSRRWRAARYGTAAVAVLALATASACSSSSSSSSSTSSTSTTSPSASPSSSASSSVTSFPRTETLYTSGTAYSPPSNWNPLDTGNYATGTQGLIYEPLFLYNPQTGTYDPWLATGNLNAGWKGSTYVINVRSGVTWSDGTPLTGADVAYSINLARTNATDPYSANVSTVADATANGNTVTVTFKGTPGYTEFTDYLWKAPVLPEHIWSKFPASQIATDANLNPVGTGPMTLDTYNTQEVVYQTKPSWWATSALGLSFKFKYLIDVVNGSNDQELGQLTAGNIDWSNNFLPGINQLMQAVGGNSGYTLKTYYPTTPYMLSANTVWLEPNDSVAPMSNVNFRKALAYALDPAVIAQTVYGGITKAANPTGLLPNLSSYVNTSVVSADAPTYNPTLAKQYLAKSGYNGQAITLQVPDGWSDWMDATTVIKSELDAIGINLQLIYPQANARTANVTDGNFDLQLDNNAGLDSTPWSYFQRVYQLPIEKQQTSELNWERFSSPADWALVQEAATVPLTDTTKLDSIYTQLETDFFAQEPVIPLWYNGAWFQGNTQYWEDYPSSTGSDQNMPVMWDGYLGAMTTVYALADLRPTPQTSS
ncbi:ABC transporter substrate-binding protein [Trebonia sp.]|uniref:ABC transporter substrate-binding protein n=1 Tax=Trebonia sp. TaxID=2767075 RepID=UPI00260936FA|nr:ABC transporter substrate-binding protein [Trebonia sp.]